MFVAEQQDLISLLRKVVFHSALAQLAVKLFIY